MDDRAQLMLIGAVVIAVAMLALVTVLNSTIYAQNVAPGNTLDETRETNEQLRVVETDVSRIGERLQQKHGYLGESRLNESLQAYAGHLIEQTAWRSPAHVDVELNWTTPTNATVLRHDPGSTPGHFRSADNNPPDWTLVENASFTGTTPLEIDVEPQDSGQGPSFHVEGDDGGEWILTVQTDDSVRVTYANGTTDSTDFSGNTVAVNVTAGTVDDENAFTFAPGLEERFDVRIEDGQHVGNGSYTITVDDESDVVGENFHDSPGDGKNPYTTTAVDTAVVDVSYGTGSVSMDTQVEVSPE